MSVIPPSIPSANVVPQPRVNQPDNNGQFFQQLIASENFSDSFSQVPVSNSNGVTLDIFA